MKTRTIRNGIGIGIMVFATTFSSCVEPIHFKTENKATPSAYKSSSDTTNLAHIKWREFFTDSNLTSLIDLALTNNQELNIVLQEINIAKNEIRGRKGAYLPSVEGGVEAGFEKVGKYTSQGASDDHNDITEGKKVPVVLPNYLVGVNMAWEVDIWKKLRNSKSAAVSRYLGTVEGKNFTVTSLIAEIANSYYELMALDNQLENLKINIALYQNSLQIVKLEKESARVTELAVRRFEAEVLKNQSRLYQINQEIIETENRINFLVGRFPQHIPRNSQAFSSIAFDSLHVGIPVQLLSNRPDVRQAEKQLAATKLDVMATRANFYPSLMIRAGLGFQAFNPSYLMQTPESLLSMLTGSLIAPIINRNAIKAEYYSANSRQIQAVYNYERSILNAHIEVSNQLAYQGNLTKSYELKAKQVDALTQSIDISTTLFRSARADYMEVLLTQRDALESKFELIEIRKRQLHTRVNMYKALGGGWN